MIVWPILLISSLIIMTKKKTGLLRLMLVMTILTSLRSVKVGIDTQFYHTTYTGRMDLSISDILMNNFRTEKGYLLLSKLFSYITSSPYIYMAIVLMIFHIILYRFIKNKSRNYFFSISLYFYLRMYDLSLNLYRQYIALIFIMLAYEMLLNKKNKESVLYYLIAMQFHTTAFIYGVNFFLLKIKYKFIYLLYSVLVSLTLTIFMKKIIQIISKVIPKYSTYLLKENLMTFNKIGTANIIAYAIITILLINVLKSKPHNYKANVYFWNLTITLNLLILSLNFSVLSRVILYFQIMNLVSIPNINNLVNSKRKRKRNYRLIILVVAIVYFIILFTKPEWVFLSDYSFYWND